MNDTLADALQRHGIELPDSQIAQLDAYCRLLWDWNTKLNLTRHTDYEKFASRDVRDTWELAKLIEEGEEVLDVGSGGGVPGIVLAILRPDLHVWLSESIAKKVGALSGMVEALGLPVMVECMRAEELLEQRYFHSIVARAVGPLDKMLVWFDRRWSNFGRLLAIKGPRWPAEKTEAEQRGLLRGLLVKKVSHYPLAGTESESVILEIRPDTSAGKRR